jgi:medium-chain acyl-[acyl-carrier-protein] hydrolase
LTNQAFMDVVSPIIRADFELIVSYRQPPGEKLRMRTTAFAGTNDDIAPSGDVERWRDLVVDGVDMHYFDGQHFFIDQRQDMVLSALSTVCLDALNGC